jgi:CheY-like chemotaxis protein
LPAFAGDSCSGIQVAAAGYRLGNEASAIRPGLFSCSRSTTGRSAMESPAVPTVLTADDNPLVRSDLRLVLEGAGFAVCADARDGVEAVELARGHRPDVILLDLRLPRLSGVDAARLIRGEGDRPVVALTGYRGFAEAALAAGAVAYVLKPFAEQELVDSVSGALAAHAGRIVEAERAESRGAIRSVAAALGCPSEWGDALEERQFRAGRVWKRGL